MGSQGHAGSTWPTPPNAVPSMRSVYFGVVDITIDYVQVASVIGGVRKEARAPQK